MILARGRRRLPLALVEQPIRIVRYQGFNRIPGAFNQIERARLRHPFGHVLALHDLAHDQIGDHDEDQPAHEPVYEAERPVYGADAAIEHALGHIRGQQAEDDQADDEGDADQESVGEHFRFDLALGHKPGN